MTPAQQDVMINGICTMQANDDYLLSLLSKMPPADQEKYRPLVMDSINATQSFLNSIKTEPCKKANQ